MMVYLVTQLTNISPLLNNVGSRSQAVGAPSVSAVQKVGPVSGQLLGVAGLVLHERLAAVTCAPCARWGCAGWTNEVGGPQPGLWTRQAAGFGGYPAFSGS